MRILNLVGAPNARDLGGTKTLFGTVKYGKLVRSGELSRLTQQDVDVLQSLPLARVLDLRTNMEKQLSPDYPFEGVVFEDVSIIRATTFGITYEKSSAQEIATKLKAGFERMSQRNETYSQHMEILYSKFVHDDHCRNGYGEFLRKLTHPVGGATLWHCTMGKDRVGTCTALLLHCLGADRQQILQDYLLTNELTAQNRNAILQKVRGHVSDEELSIIDKMLQVSPTYLQSFYDEIEKDFGSVDGFIAACGVSEQDIATLRELYLD